MAWGPGVHVVLSNWLMHNACFLPPEAIAPIMQFPGQFIHGALSPDVFIGKGSAALVGHSHNWESGLRLFERSGAARWRAYSYGYLSHLAADTVAHTVFVPATLASAPGNGRLAHVYLEALADNALPWQAEQALRAFQEDGSRRTARLLKAVITRNKAFGLRRAMFQGSIALENSDAWRRSMNLFGKMFSPEDLRPLLDAMFRYSLRAVVSVLRDPHGSPVRALDPVGSDALLKSMTAARPLLPQVSLRRFLPSRASGNVKPPARDENIKLDLRLPDILTQLPPVAAGELYPKPCSAASGGCRRLAPDRAGSYDGKGINFYLHDRAAFYTTAFRVRKCRVDGRYFAQRKKSAGGLSWQGLHSARGSKNCVRAWTSAGLRWQKPPV